MIEKALSRESLESLHSQGVYSILASLSLTAAQIMIGGKNTKSTTITKVTAIVVKAIVVTMVTQMTTFTKVTKVKMQQGANKAPSAP